MSAHPSIGRRIVWRLSAMFLCAVTLSSAIFLYNSWIQRVDHLDRSLRRVATQLAGAIRRNFPRSPADQEQCLGSPANRRIALASLCCDVSGDGGDRGGLHARIDWGDLSVARPSDTPWRIDLKDASRQSERGYILIADRPVGRLRVLVSSPNLSLADTMAWMQDEAVTELLPILAPLFIGVLVVAPSPSAAA